MKDFWKIVLASALGFLIVNIIFSILSMLFFFGLIGSMDSSMSGSSTFVLENNSVLNLRLSGSIAERVADNDVFSEFMAPSQMEMGLNDVVGAIRKAASNDKIAGIYLDCRSVAAAPATLLEIRNELLRYKESGKFLVAYADNYAQSDYFLASVADKIAINPKGMLDIHGMASSPVFYKDALEKIGVKMQIFKVGTYKSAVEPYMQMEMSDANREQINAFLSDLWVTMKTDISESRQIPVAEVDSIANSGAFMQDTEFYLQKNLVDTLLYETDMKQYVAALADKENFEDINMATVTDMKSVKGNAIKKTKNTIALLYAEGNIASGTGSANIQDKFLVNEIEKLRRDDDIKAVVFRVNSGGGSAYASEQIWDAITKLKAQKPVVVSMGDYAASGGYYISCNASKIVAQPNTLTGSIGIFGMIPSFEGTTKKIGVKTETVKTNEFADFGKLTRDLNDKEKALFQQNIERGYDLFVTRCAEGRGMSKETLMQYAEGRVWSGNQAKEIGLVDELGGIDTAINIAAELANLGKSYVVFEYPKKLTPWEEFLNKDKNQLAIDAIKETFGNNIDLFLMLQDATQQDRIQARMTFDPNIH